MEIGGKWENKKVEKGRRGGAGVAKASMGDYCTGVLQGRKEAVYEKVKS